MLCQKLPVLIVGCLCAAMFTACTPTGYFVSPMYGSSTPHHSTPMQTDSIKSAWYLNGAFSPADNNYGYDNSAAGQVNIYHANTFKYLNVYYGTGLTLGGYTVNAYYSDVHNHTPYAANTSSQFFGSLNFSGGANFVIPFGRTGEWRIIGVHESLQKEFGSYLKFRRGFDKDSVDGVATSSTLNTIGFSSELAFNLPHHVKLGGFLQYNILTGPQYKDIYFGVDDEGGPERYAYVSLGMFMGFKRYMFFIQSNQGEQVFGASFGMNYRLSK